MGIFQQPIFIFMIAFIIICLALLVMLVLLIRTIQSKQRTNKKAAMDAGFASVKNPKPQSKAFAMSHDDYDFDDPLAELDAMRTPQSAMDDDDPLAELYQARAEAEDDDATDLASLLSGMGQEPLHTVAEGQVNVQLPDGETARAREMLSILRDESDGRLMVQFGDTAYRSLLDSPEAKQEFTRLMKELSGMILKPDDRPAKVEAKPAAASQTEPTATISEPQADDEPSIADLMSQPQQEAAQESKRPIRAAKELDAEERLPGDLPSFKVPDNPDNYTVGRFGRVSVKKVDKAPELNIAQAIETYLQYKIEQNPEYQRRGIHIKPAVHGGVRIEADGKAYEFVDEVADPDVRKFIQTAISEWQERH